MDFQGNNNFVRDIDVNENNYKLSKSNIDLITKNSHRSPQAFYFERQNPNNPSLDIIRIHSRFSEFFSKLKHELFGSRNEHGKQLQIAVHRSVKYLNLNPVNPILRTPNDYSEHILSAQRFNHLIGMAKQDELKSDVPLFANLNLRALEEFSNTKSIKINGEITSTLLENIPDDQHPHIIHKGFFHKHKCFHYNEADLEHSHTTDAAKIFLSTHLERFKSLVGRVVESVGRIFNLEIKYFSSYHYFRNNEDKNNEIYANDAPLVPTQNGSSYFVGHATCAINIPIQSDGCYEPIFVNIITDPVEGDLNKLFYPRMTDPARKMEECPVPHVFLLSHNHLDHYDHNTLLKLVKYQPVMLVPEGDMSKFKKLGFKNVHENNWWQTKTIPIEQDGKKGELKITAVPANHWSGQQGPCDGHHSAFVGFVIHKEGGDIYFAGDTARLMSNHIKTLRDRFDIRTMFQPGGPDECRENMKGTHQSSVDAIWMHFQLMLQNLYDRGYFIDRPKAEFIEEAKKLRTIYMHNKTFKLGNLHFDDTDASVARLKSAISNQGHLLDLRPHEFDVFTQINDLGQELIFQKAKIESVANNEFGQAKLTSHEILEILEAGIVIPKIGSRTDFAS